LGTLAVSNFAGNLSFTSSLLTLAPGQDAYITIDSEASNVGGFNGGFGTAENGVEALINGVFGALPVSLSVFDKDIHSGSPRINPFGVTLDNYVLQGGDPLGRDTGDSFETTQAEGTFEFLKSSRGVVPVPAALPLSAARLAVSLFSAAGAGDR
jgi:hypothetical protein